MEIVLLRHGKPKIDSPGKLGPADFGSWVEEYNRAGIDTECSPTKEAREKAARCAFVVCSTLPRSLESAEQLNIETVDLVSHDYRECEMPYAKLTYPKLPILTWAIGFRILQRLGYAANAESYRAIKSRSKACAEQLTKLSQQHHSVIFIGHGTLIWFIHRHLLRIGWAGPRKSARKHWEFGVYVQ